MAANVFIQSFFIYSMVVSVVPSDKIHINRYFLPVDNIFDYMKEKNFLLENETNSSSIEQHWIYQPLDHFNPLESWRFWQKYLFRTSSEKNGPICIYIGGDTAIHSWWLRHTFLARQCTELNGQLFLLEHRYYGDSIPMSSNRDNLSIANLKYLTIAQALEDVAHFVPYIRKLFKLEKNKLFVFGADYGGTLAALFRRKYPHLTDAAVAMSAPMKREYHNKEYLQTVGKKLKKINPMCFMQIEQGLRHAGRLMDNHICNKKELPLCNKIRDNLGICSPMKGMTKLERQIFFTTLIKDFAFLAEYDGMLEISLKDICDVVNHRNISDWSPLNKLLAADIIISQELFNSKLRLSGECLQIKKQNICGYLRNVSINHEVVYSGKRQRLWQTCAELASFRISGASRLHPFGDEDMLPASFFQDICVCSFGGGFTESFTKSQIDAYTVRYGSSSPLLGSRIIYTIGEEDPVLQREIKTMDKLGIKARYNENVMFKVKGSAHCGEVFTTLTRKHTTKSKHVAIVQKGIGEQLMEWLQ